MTPPHEDRAASRRQIGRAVERLGALVAPLRDEGYRVTFTVDEAAGEVTIAIIINLPAPSAAAS